MKLSLPSFNLQGLSTTEARNKASNFVRDFTPKTDILCVQQHKLCQANVQLLQAQIWREAHFLISPAVDGANAQRNDNVLAGKGGLFTVIGPRLQNFVVSSGITGRGHGIWIQLKATSYIIPGYNMSDHAPVVASITTRRSERPSYYRMNANHLQDPILQEKIRRMWSRERAWHERVNSDPLTLMLNYLKQAKKITRTWGKAKAEERKREESLL